MSSRLPVLRRLPHFASIVRSHVPAFCSGLLVWTSSRMAAASVRPYSASQLKELARGMKGGPESLAVAGVVVLGIAFFGLLVVAARQTSFEEEAREAERTKRRSRRSRVEEDETRVWRKTAKIHTTQPPV